VDDPAGRPALTGDSHGDGDPGGRVIPDGLDATLVLVRHGESTYIAEGRFQGQADPPLTDIGRRQAALVAVRLAQPHRPPAIPVPIGEPRELIQSPLGRTTQTADAIQAAIMAQGRAISRRAEPGFLEIDQGAWQGLHRTEIRERYGSELAAWRRAPLDNWAPGGESLPQMQARVRPALRSVLERLADGAPPGTHDRSQVAGYRDPRPDHPWSIVVGHDGTFKVALLTLFDLPLDRFWMWSMDLCGISVIELRAGRPVVRAHNLTDHLAALDGAVAPDSGDTGPPDGAFQET
jgi:broad specificity phosphatase PhoE